MINSDLSVVQRDDEATPTKLLPNRAFSQSDAQQNELQNLSSSGTMSSKFF